jgi:hypothetical protein
MRVWHFNGVITTYGKRDCRNSWRYASLAVNRGAIKRGFTVCRSYWTHSKSTSLRSYCLMLRASRGSNTYQCYSLWFSLRTNIYPTYLIPNNTCNYLNIILSQYVIQTIIYTPSDTNLIYVCDTIKT